MIESLKSLLSVNNKSIIYTIVVLLFLSNSLCAQDYIWHEIDYQFEDINDNNNTLGELAGDDNATTQEINLSAYFNFYGTDYPRIKVAVNGALTFDVAATGISSNNYKLPSVYATDLLVAPYWNNLTNESAESNIYYHTNSQRAIIQWNNLEIKGTNETITMQVVLGYADNSIIISYKEITNNTPGSANLATIGIQNNGATEGICLAYNDSFADGFTMGSLHSYKILIPQAYQPIMTPSGGAFSTATNITISATPVDAQIYYTLDGSQPTSASTLYTAPVNISETATLKAIAVKNNYSTPVTTEKYKIITQGSAIDSGIVSGNWSLANSPYHILGDIVIPNDSCLTIEAGTKILFEGAFDLIVEGCINANGTAQNHIVFQNGYTTDWWKGISFSSLNDSNSASGFNYCEFTNTHAKGGKSPENNGGAFRINNWNNITITNSSFENNKADSKGGAIYCSYSDIEISNNTFQNNSSSYQGGAIYVIGSKIIINNNTLTYNNSVDYGGGLYLADIDSGLISNNTFSHNAVSARFSSGGGMYAANTNAEITNNEFAYNEAYLEGGGLTLNGSNDIFFAYNNIHHNQTNYIGKKSTKTSTPITPTIKRGKQKKATNTNKSSKGLGSGGGIHIGGGTGTVASNKIHNNSTHTNGGGIYLSSGTVYVNSNYIAYNVADGSGGGMCINSCNQSLSNNSFVFNSSQRSGDAICFIQSNSDIYNSLFWYNNGDGSFGDIFVSDDGSAPNFYNCSDAYGVDNIDGNWFGGWTYDGVYQDCNSHYPAFEYSKDTILGLQYYSPMINTGAKSTLSLKLPDSDANGNPRIVDKIVDIGCFEYQGSKITNIIGGIMSDTISKGIYYVDADIYVQAGKTLTIEAGTELRFYGNQGFTIKGNIQAIGTENEHIIITSADTTAYNSMLLYTTGGWKHMAFEVPDANSRFEYVDFSFSKVNNLFLTDFSDQAGGTALMINASPEFIHCTFDNNFTYGSGGALSYYDSKQNGGKVESCIFSNNIAVSSSFMLDNLGGRGGAIYIQNSSPAITNNLLFSNTAVQGVASNIAIGGALFAVNTESKFINNTIAYNYSPNAGGMYCAESDDFSMKNTPVFVNNIFWGNSADLPSYGDQIRIDGATDSIRFYNNNISGGLSQIKIGNDPQFNGTYTDNINSNPLFTAITSDFSLKSNSPCINKGLVDMSAYSISDYDLSGNQRIFDGIIDIGAYESQIVSIRDQIKNEVEVEVYPNPSNGVFTIVMSDVRCKMSDVKCQTTNITGKTINNYQSTIDNNQFFIDLSNHPNGIYILKISTTEFTAHKRIVISR